MSIDVETIERLISRYWKPDMAKPEDLRQIAGEIMKTARRASSIEAFKSELAKVQVNRLHQKLDKEACDDIATRVFAAAQA
jgi:hypothetical protein